jgi:DNA gyrase subunit A
LTNGAADIFLAASSGKAIRFNEKDVREMGRGAAGVRGISLEADHKVMGLIIVEEGEILTVTANGYGKRTQASEFSAQGRGGKGVIAIQTSKRNGDMVGAIQVSDDDEVMLISSSGTLVRTGVHDISVQGRNTQGVRLIRLAEGDRLVGLDRIVQIQGDDAVLEE